MEFNKIRSEIPDDYPVVNNHKITGSGIAIIETKQFTNSVGAICDDIVILLTRDGDPNIFSIFGGALDIGQTINSTAIEELQQESLNMFNLSQTNLTNCPFVTINGGIHFDSNKKSKKNRTDEHGYLCYFVHLSNETELGVYFNNRNKIISHKNIPRCFLETDYMTRLSLNQFVHDFDEQGICHLQTMDINGNKIILRGRDCLVLYEAFNNKIFRVSKTNNLIKSNLIKHNTQLMTYQSNTNSMPYLNDTLCYVLV